MNNMKLNIMAFKHHEDRYHVIWFTVSIGSRTGLTYGWTLICIKWIDKLIKYYTKQKGNYNIFGAEFVENNKNNIDLIINAEKHILINNIELMEGKNTIIMLIKNQLSNLN